MSIKVVKIIDDMNIVLNCGENNSIKEGDKFNIYSDEVEVVEDPETNETLGEIKKIKANVEVVSVYEKMCICQNAKTTASISEIAANALTLGGKRISLNVDPSQISGGRMADEDKMIRIGDKAEKIG